MWPVHLDKMCKLLRAVSSGRSVPHAREAACSFLGACCEDGEDCPSVVTYDGRRSSAPYRSRDSVDSISVLPGHRRQELENIEDHLFRDASELDNTRHIPPCLDVSFAHSKRKHHVALRRVITAGLLRPVRHRKVRSRRLSSPRETTDNKLF